MKKSCFKGRICSKEGVVNKDNCHSKLDLESSTQVVYEQQQQASKILDQVQDDRMIRTAYGFTLIELLVVVLIIGILAAVAVPQYRKVVNKSYTVEAITALDALVQAQEVFFLANGKYTNNLEKLDITLPQVNTNKYRYFCREDWKCCQAESKDWNNVPAIQYNFINVVSADLTEQPSQRLCIAKPGKRSEDICKSLTKTEKVTGGANYSFYNIDL